MKIIVEERQLAKIVQEWAENQPFEGTPEITMVNKKKGVEFTVDYIQSETEDVCEEDVYETEDIETNLNPITNEPIEEESTYEDVTTEDEQDNQ